MKLATLVTEIEGSRGPVTGIELALRLGIQPAEIAAMLAALRASGRLGPEVRSEPAPADCSSAGACSLPCPGPGDCPLVIDVSVSGLEIKNR
ncbi:MAG: hypothetical protein U9N84_02330 [Actinomycetota bacterium]|nr:hypothetical protein [Actinomycetota bacterium]